MSLRFQRLARRFPRKRAFITGASSGLGLELARALGNDGWTLGLFDRNVERLARVEEELSGAGFTVLAYPGDVTNPDEVIQACDTALEMGPLRSLETAAGIGMATRTIGKDGSYESAHNLDL